MEQLTIKGFLVIKEARLDVGKINVIIGPQASGKSVLAKLLFFFRGFLNSTFINSARSFGTKRDVTKYGLETFAQYFPRYTWSEQEFKIIYRAGNLEVTISRGKKRGAALTLDYSSELQSLHRSLKTAYKRKQNALRPINSQARTQKNDEFQEVVRELIFEKNIGKPFRNSLFIPAGRSFFASLQKNVFSYLAGRIDIDPFVKEFGSGYETAKRLYGGKYYHDADMGLLIKVKEFVERVLGGKYRFEDEQDWIESNDVKINLSNASSGQQEALPMLLIMSLWPFLGRDATLFIEEPEAHLFPVSQKNVMSLIALIHRQLKQDFVITTHSPYILTALNNLILGNDVMKSVGEAKVKKIVDPDLLIAYEDVRAYTIQNGKLVSIMDDEERLIGTNIIDGVSDEFSEEFESLLDLLSGTNA